MKQHYKKIALPFIFLFAFPVVTASCCCAEPAVEKPAANSSHHHSSSRNENHSHHHEQPNSSHDHNLCNHGPIIGNLVHQTPFIFSGDAIGKFLKHPLLLQEENKVVSAFSQSSFSDHGPPGLNLSEIPLYLQISALRI